MMTLFLMPVLYFIFNRLREKREEKNRLKLERKQALLAGAGGNA